MAIIKHTRTQNLYSVTITWPNITTARSDPARQLRW